MSVLDYLNPIKAVANGVVKVKESIWGSKKDQDQQAHDRFVTGQQVYSAEFAQRKNRTIWDSFWDGINRMPRPVIVITIFSYFGLAYFNQIEFQKLNIALDTVPEKMWWIMTSIVSFYFVSREFQKGREKKMAMSDEAFDKVQERMARLTDNEPLAAPRKSGYINPSVDAWQAKKSGKKPKSTASSNEEEDWGD